MPPAIDFLIDGHWPKPLWPLRNNDACAAFIEIRDEPVAVESLVGQQVLEVDAFNEWRHADGVVSVAGQENKADKIAQRIGQREDFGRPAAFRFANGLILSPPLAPCP